MQASQQPLMQSAPAGAPQPQQVMPAPPGAPVMHHMQYNSQQHMQQNPYQQQQQQQQMQQQQQQMQQQQYPQQQQQQQQVQNSNLQQPQHQAPAGQHTANAPGQSQHFPQQGLNGGWQSDQDYSERRAMIAKIVHLLKQRKPNAPQDWLKKLPQMAKRLEESLYRSATSFDEYNDASTLKQRLQQLAHNIGMRTRRMQQQQQQQQQTMHTQPNQQQYMNNQSNQQLQQQQTNQQPIAPLQHHQQQQPVQPRPPPQPMHQPPAPQQHQQQMHQQMQQQMQQPQMQQQGQRIVNVAEINPIMNSQPQMVQPSPAPQPQYQYQQQPAPAPLAQAPAPQTQLQAPAPAVGQNGTGAQAGRQISDRQQVLRHQQQRLLLLRHAAKCQHEDGRCPVTPHCAGMKRLWKHIAECKDQKCLVPHCVSSRYVLSHYHRCKDVRCPVCGPVREAIHRSHEKQKQMQAQRQQQQMQQVNVQPAPGQQMVQQQLTAPPPIQPVAGVPAPIQPPAKRQRSVQGVAVPVQQYQAQPIQTAQGQQQTIQAPLHQPNSSLQQTAPVQQQVQQPFNNFNQQTQMQQVPPGAQPAPIQTAPGVAYQNGQVITPKFTGPKPQEDHTLINCFTIEQIETHIASLNKGLQLPPQKLKTKCLEVLKLLQSHQHGWVFNSPVDPVELGLPDYFEVIRRPMDLGTIRKKLENNCYHSLDEFQEHVHLTFDNAMLYNPEGSVVYNMASEMKSKFEQDFALLMKQLNAEEDQKRRNGEACLLCGCEKLLFEPPVFYCNGLNCPSKRIRRNSYYYVGGNNQYHWCHQCFQELKDGRAIELGDITIRKEQLTKKKNDEVHEESWVQCDRCERWIHQICALFNTRQNKDQRSEFACPRCTIEERKKKGQTEGTSSTPVAEDLQRTKLSEYLENHVREKMEEHLESEAQRIAAQGTVTLEEARKQIEMGGAITIRQVTSMDKKLEVRERMKRRYAFRNYPDEFNYRCKCIIVFQNLDGVDVILFGLYVYEHDEKNKPPNQRAVYISYLDSVHYMRPKNMRTFIYHEILISYLDYVRKRGFASAHIWACPPLKGDDYILYAKPEDQKTPKDDRLRQWYIDMLVEAQKRGFVGKITNMYDEYFANKENDATVVPYMDGDYFPAEVENIIKDIEEGKTGKKSGSSEKKKKNDKSKQKKKSGRGGTRSTGLDEEALKASGILTPGKDQKSLEEGGRDYVMVRLGETIQPMKESFIVAYLAWEGAKEENMVVPKEIEEYREKHGIVVKCKPKEEVVVKDEGTPKEEEKKDGSIPENAPKSTETSMENGDAGKTSEGDAEMAVVSSESADKTPEDGKEGDDPSKPTENSEDPLVPSSDSNAMAAETVKSEDATDKVTNESDEATKPSDPPASDPADVPAPTASNPSVPADGNATPAAAPVSAPEKAVKVLPMEQRAGKFAAMARKRGREEGDDVKKEEEAKEDVKEEKEEPAVYVTDSKGRRVKVIDDDLEEMDCEFLNNRQAFLNLCQGNHYQFDHLRRAKHSSMMVLWHLHNRDAPKFVQQCTTCSREILSGHRFHCPTCADFDQCQDCVQNPNAPRHPHPLKPIPVSGQQTELTESQRKERQRSIQLHMTLLLHAATCSSPKCPSANCTKMKGLLKHGAQCQQKATGGCSVCKRIWALLQIHARQCKATSCPVPNCMAIRERVRQLKKQQQAMDDRRRQEMNRVYRGAR